MMLTTDSPQNIVHAGSAFASLIFVLTRFWDRNRPFQLTHRNKGEKEK